MKKQTRKKLLTLLMACTMTFSMLSACSSKSDTTGNNVKSAKGNETSTATAGTSGLDISKHVDLTVYLTGNAPKDISLITDKINQMAEKDLNATVTFNFLPFTDLTQKYKLLLTSGQPVDLIYTASWIDFGQIALQGAFRPLDDLLPKVAPDLYKFVPKEYWDQGKVDNKIYTVPSTYQQFNQKGVAYREDLREKYKLPKPDSLENLEAYLDGIKKNEPDILPLADNQNAFKAASDYNMKGLLELSYGLQTEYDNPRNVKSFWGSPAQLTMLETFKRWADKGLISKNQLNDQANDHDIFAAGKASAIISSENPNKFGDDVMKIGTAHPDWKLAYYPMPYSYGFAVPAPQGDGTAIPINSKNPERALALLEKLILDKNYNLLTQYGIEGTHYKVENNYYQSIGDAGASGFPREGFNAWNLRNPEYMLSPKSYDVVKQIFSDLKKIEKPNYQAGFIFNTQPVQAEIAAVNQVEKQYLDPVIAGLVKDPATGMNTFMEKANQAGLEKLQAEYKKQWFAYLDTIGK